MKKYKAHIYQYRNGGEWAMEFVGSEPDLPNKLDGTDVIVLVKEDERTENFNATQLEVIRLRADDLMKQIDRALESDVLPSSVFYGLGIAKENMLNALKEN